MSEWACKLCGKTGDIFEEEYVEDACQKVNLVALCQDCAPGYALGLTQAFGEVSLDNVSTPPWADKA